MRKQLHSIFIISVFIFCYQGVIAQNTTIDSLEQSLTLSNEIDTSRLTLLREIEMQELNLAKEIIERKLERSQFFVKLLIVGIIILIVFGFFILNYIRFREMNKVDDLKTNLAKDLHDNIGSLLNHIKILSNRLAKGNNENETQLELALKIKKLSNEVMYNMYDMLWKIDSRKSRIKDLVQHMRDHLTNTIPLSGNSIKLEFDDLKKEEFLKMSVKGNLFSIFKEAINNISKHTNSTNIFISLKNINANEYELIIKNEFKEKKKDQPFSSKKGLKNIHERAKAINGKLEIVEKTHSFLLKLEWKNK